MPAPKGNTYWKDRLTNGRPPVYDSPEDLQAAIDEYFEWCKGEYKEMEVMEPNPEGGEGKLCNKLDEFGDPIKKIKCLRQPENITSTGLALYLGFASRQSLHDYEKDREGYSYVIRQARCRVENSYEHDLRDRQKARGSEFALSNMGWATASRHEVTGAEGKPLFAEKTDAELSEQLKALANKVNG